MISPIALVLGLAAALAAASAAPATAQFYKGKTIAILINYPPGGPTDIEGRIVARHIANHIPGKPNVIAKNMPGGAGNIATNYLGQTARRDPTQLAFFTWSPMDQLLGDPGLLVKYEDFVFVAGVAQPVVVYMRTDVAPGVKQPLDLFKTANFRVGALAPHGHGTLRTAFALDMLGIKYKQVAGYKGLKEVETAVLQNEVQLSNSSLPGFRASIEPNMVKTGTVIPLFHFDTQRTDGSFGRSPALPELMAFLELYRARYGKDAMPSGPRWETMVMLNNQMDQMFRVSLLPPGVPREAADELRAAFTAMWKDEAFLSDYEKSIKNRPALVSGAEGEKIMASIAQTRPQVIKFIKDYVEESTK